jgi:chromosomal replication initiation ATPase DnaA
VKAPAHTMGKEDTYAQLLKISADRTRKAQMARLNPSIFDTIRKNNNHDEKVVIEGFAQMAGVPVSRLLGRERKLALVNARHLLAYVLRKNLGLSMAQVAALTRKDISTVQNSIDQAEEILKDNDFLIGMVEQIVERARRKRNDE